MQIESLKKQVVELHPWHFDIDIRDGLTTEYSQTVDKDLLPIRPGAVSFLKEKPYFMNLLETVYPDGMKGKSLLDCACNCGAYCFWAKEYGAKRTYGFDVRKHWIRQAKFLARNRERDTSKMRFKVCDLYDVPKLRLAPFDMSIFSGIFYHLPDPISGLKIAADRTNEVMYFDTATTNIMDPESISGGLMASFEGTESFMSGVHGLNWYPTGPKVLKHILSWMGFCQIKVVEYRKDLNSKYDSGSFVSCKGRISILASKVAGMLDNVQDVSEKSPATVDTPTQVSA